MWLRICQRANTSESYIFYFGIFICCGPFKHGIKYPNQHPIKEWTTRERSQVHGRETQSVPASWKVGPTIYGIKTHTWHPIRSSRFPVRLRHLVLALLDASATAKVISRRWNDDDDDFWMTISATTQKVNPIRATLLTVASDGSGDKPDDPCTHRLCGSYLTCTRWESSGRRFESASCRRILTPPNSGLWLGNQRPWYVQPCLCDG